MDHLGTLDRGLWTVDLGTNLGHWTLDCTCPPDPRASRLEPYSAPVHLITARVPAAPALICVWSAPAPASAPVLLLPSPTEQFKAVAAAARCCCCCRCCQPLLPSQSSISIGPRAGLNFRLFNLLLDNPQTVRFTPPSGSSTSHFIPCPPPHLSSPPPRRRSAISVSLLLRATRTCRRIASTPTPTTISLTRHQTCAIPWTLAPCRLSLCRCDCWP